MPEDEKKSSSEQKRKIRSEARSNDVSMSIDIKIKSVSVCLSVCLSEAMSTGKEKKSDFRLSDFCLSVVTCYILLSTAPRPQARFSYYDFRTPEIRVEIWRVTVATAAQTTSFFLSLFLDSSFFFIFSSYVHKIP